MAVRIGEQIEALKDEADLLASHAGSLAVGEPGDVDAADVERATSRLHHEAEDVQQGRLTAAARAHEDDEFAATKREIDTVQDRPGSAVVPIGVVEVRCSQQYVGFGVHGCSIKAEGDDGVEARGPPGGIDGADDAADDGDSNAEKQVMRRYLHR